MKSGEIAKLAGVTVRTLRHYRTIGLLPEPPRTENGYANYSLDHLVRILRIKQLASLGFSLERINEILTELDTEAAPNSPHHLDELDRQLALRIEELEQQRHTIALLKQHQLDADVPLRFVDMMVLLRSKEPVSAWPSFEKDAVLLAEHLLDDATFEEVKSLYQGIIERDLVADYHVLDERLQALPATASAEEQDELIARGTALLEEILDCFDPENWDRPETELEVLFEQIETEQLNNAQREVSYRIVENIERKLLQNRQGDGLEKPENQTMHKQARK